MNAIYKASFNLRSIIYGDYTTLIADLEDFFAKTITDFKNEINSGIDIINIWSKEIVFLSTKFLP